MSLTTAPVPITLGQTISFPPPEGQAGQLAVCAIVNLSQFLLEVGVPTGTLYAAPGTITPVALPGTGQALTITAAYSTGTGQTSGGVGAQWYYRGENAPAGAVAIGAFAIGGSVNATELQGVPVQPASPAAGQALAFNGTDWAPGVGLGLPATLSSDSATATALQIDVVADAPNGLLIQDTGITVGVDLDVVTSTLTTGDIVELFQSTSAFSGVALNMDLGSGGGSFDGDFLVCTNAGTVKASLDSTGALTCEALSVAGGVDATELQGIAVSATAPTTGQALTYNGTDWAPATPSGGAGVVIGHTFEAPTTEVAVSVANAGVLTALGTEWEVSFTAPASGNILIEALPYIYSGDVGYDLSFGWLNGLSQVGVTEYNPLSSNYVRYPLCQVISGLTAGDAYTLSLAACLPSPATASAYILGAESSANSFPLTITVTSL
jgi:hypothetical protein